MTEKAKPDAEQQGGDPESSLGMRVLPHVGPGPWRWVHKQDLESEWVEGGAVALAVVGPPPPPPGSALPSGGGSSGLLLGPQQRVIRALAGAKDAFHLPGAGILHSQPLPGSGA